MLSSQMVSENHVLFCNPGFTAYQLHRMVKFHKVSKPQLSQPQNRHDCGKTITDLSDYN